VIAVISHDPAGGARENLPLDQVPALLKDRTRVIWIDLTAPSKEEMTRLTSWLPLHPLALEDCESRRHHPKIDDYGEYLFILTHGVDPESSAREFRTRQLGIFLGPNYLVTYHKQRSRSAEHALESLRKNPRVIGAGPGSVLYNILEHQIDLYFPVLDQFAVTVDAIERSIFTDATSRILQEVFDFKKAIMRLRRIAGHQREILARLTRREFPIVDEATVLNMRNVYDHLVRITDFTDTYRELVSDALQAHLSIVSNRTNEIMRLLMVFATLFLPLTFIVGVYGMNFPGMPETHWKHGYLYVWCLMSVVAAGLYLYFRRRGLFARIDR